MAKGDLTATNELMAKYEPMVHSFLRNTTFKDATVDHEEAAQELRLALVRATRQFDPDRGVQFTTYVYMAMSNAKKALFVKSSRRPWIEDISDMEVAGLGDAEEPAGALEVPYKAVLLR